MAVLISNKIDLFAHIISEADKNPSSHLPLMKKYWRWAESNGVYPKQRTINGSYWAAFMFEKFVLEN